MVRVFWGHVRTPSETLVVECPTCSARSEAMVAGWLEYLISPRHPQSGRWLLARCKSCKDGLLLDQKNVGNEADGDIWGTARRLFPVRSFYINPAAPELVQEFFAEAVTTFEAGAFTAAAIMSRRAIEGVCAEHGVLEGNLAKSLAKLRSSGVINDHLFEWADMLRVAGNDAAHSVASRISRDDARDMLELTGAIIDYVFSFRDKFVAFKERRALLSKKVTKPKKE